MHKQLTIVMLPVDPALIYPNVSTWWSSAQPLEIRYALAVKASPNPEALRQGPYARASNELVAVETRIVEQLKEVTPTTTGTASHACLKFCNCSNTLSNPYAGVFQSTSSHEEEKPSEEILEVFAKAR